MVSKQNTISFFFSKEEKKVAVKEVVGNTVKTVVKTAEKAENTEKDINAFYASLSSNERRAHEIAIKSLGTSYDVRATHGFRKWLGKK